ncbi:MAG: MFS transporter, partial [Microbacteriaceae bacterium]
MTINVDASHSLSKRGVFRYAIGSLGTGGYNTLPGLVLVYYLTDTLGVAALWAGILVTVAKIWDVIIDPFIGNSSDAALRRHGSRRKPMLLGAICLPVLFVLTFSVIPGIPPLWAGIWVLLAFVLAAIAFSFYQVPYIALPAEITQGYDDRTRLITWRVVVLTFAILIFGGGGPEIRDIVTKMSGDPYLGYFAMALVLGLVIAFAMLFSLKVVPKQAVAPVQGNEPQIGFLARGFDSYRLSIRAFKRSAPFRSLWIAFTIQSLAIGLLLAVVQYVAVYVLETSVTFLFVSLIAPAILFTPLWRMISKRIGKEQSFVWASLLFAFSTAATIGLVWAPGEWVYIPVIFAGIAFAGIQALALAMLPDVISHDAKVHGEAQAGVFSGVWTAGETSGLAFGATILAIVLSSTG